MTDGMTPLDVDDVDDHISDTLLAHPRHPGTSCAACGQVAQDLAAEGARFLGLLAGVPTSDRRFERRAAAAGKLIERAGAYAEGAQSKEDYDAGWDDYGVITRG